MVTESGNSELTEGAYRVVTEWLQGGYRVGYRVVIGW